MWNYRDAEVLRRWRKVGSECGGCEAAPVWSVFEAATRISPTLSDSAAVVGRGYENAGIVGQRVTRMLRPRNDAGFHLFSALHAEPRTEPGNLRTLQSG